ncbi:MAG: hypothetical protein JXQ79_03200 [Rhodobacteraceae bacterium]|nr:hypothetical protein [Paracoccaceae bacterium]
MTPFILHAIAIVLHLGALFAALGLGNALADDAASRKPLEKSSGIILIVAVVVLFVAATVLQVVA